MRKKSILMIFVLLNVIGLVANIYCGSASIAIGDITDVLTGKDIGNSAISYIVIHSRIPASVTALLTGLRLACADFYYRVISAIHLPGLQYLASPRAPILPLPSAPSASV